MACGAGLSVSSEPLANSFSVNSRALTPRKLFQLLQNFRVARGRRRRSQIQRVGNQAGQQQAGDVGAAVPRRAGKNSRPRWCWSSRPVRCGTESAAAWPARRGGDGQ